MNPGALFNAGPYGGQLFDPGPGEVPERHDSDEVAPRCPACAGTVAECRCSTTGAVALELLEGPGLVAELRGDACGRCGRTSYWCQC